MKEIILITGGQRSGKSNYAEQLALSFSTNPVYMATSRVWDEEHRQRIEHHKQKRGKQWITIEEEKELSKYDLKEQTVLIDCLTLWATNYFFDNDSNIEQSLQQLTAEYNRLILQDATFIFVTNEIGMGEISQNGVQRRFADLQGWLNQYIAKTADQVLLMVSGIPLKIK